MSPLLQLTNGQIGAWVASFVLPLFRIAALLMSMPIIGTTLVSTRIRLYLALAITVVIAPTLPPMPQIEALDLGAAVLIVKEIVIGVAMGFSLQLFFHAFVVAGQILSTQMGMGFASMIDPTNGVSAAVIGQFFTMLVTLVFLSMNGHLVVFEVVADSFTTLPVGADFIPSHYWELAGRLGWVLGAGLVLVLPAITALLIVSVAMGVMTRAAPQLNIFSIGFPISLIGGLLIMWVDLADLLNQYQPLAEQALQLLRELVRVN